jgi:hypothetical protein
MANYYYIIAGLPDISFDDSKAAYTVEQFREEVYASLSNADRKVMDLLLLEDTCRSLIQDRDNFELTDDMPKFIGVFLRELKDESWRQKAAFAEDRLWSLFYEYAMSMGNGFVRSWYEFNLNMNNIMAAITARKYNLDIQKVIVGTGDVANALRTSGARDWGLSQEVECFEDVARLTEEDDLSQRERKADMIRWRWLEDNTFFNYFSVEKLFSYMVRLGMVQRWSSLDREEGQKLFRKLIGDLKQQTEVPDEFRV